MSLRLLAVALLASLLGFAAYIANPPLKVVETENGRVHLGTVVKETISYRFCLRPALDQVCTPADIGQSPSKFTIEQSVSIPNAVVDSAGMVMFITPVVTYQDQVQTAAMPLNTKVFKWPTATTIDAVIKDLQQFEAETLKTYPSRM